MGEFERFELQLARPRALLRWNLLVHALLALPAARAICAGVTPTPALWSLLLLIAAHLVYEHRRLGTAPAALRIDGNDAYFDADPWSWRLHRVACATRGLYAAEFVQHAGDWRLSRRWLLLAGDQLAERDARRLLRWMRAGSRAPRTAVSS